VNVRRSRTLDLSPFETQSLPGDERCILNAEAFHRMITVERKRTERSGKPFLLMLLDTANCPPSVRNGQLLSNVIESLAISTRETDVTGWYQENSVVGVMFTELGTEERNLIVSTVLERVSATLRSRLSFEQFNQISISFYLFPEEWDDIADRPSNPMLYPDLQRRDNARKFHTAVKRAMDVLGSLIAILLLSPIFLAIAAAVKLTSRGPIFFRQQRIGQFGVPFTFFKFRSMHVDNDASKHKQYVLEMIAGKAERKPNGNGDGVFKLTNDPRITKVGAWLRRTSLDEIPQFFNVLKGEMSLVGPRPPIAYEVEAYEVWHRRRMLEAKPGITGLWQVTGRSRVKFDEMVRLDLRYAKTWSPWMDVQILLRTPRAVVMGDGAF
jgi:exopolysaccharide biosynthesis polyprenyl glycosylphosphotransferase